MKKLFDAQINQKGFVLIEFVIALPLIILLLYGLAQTTLRVYGMSDEHAEDYELEVEAQEVLRQIVEEARLASQVTRSKRFGYKDIETLSMRYHTIVYDAGKIVDRIDRRVYVVSDAFKLNAKRIQDGTYLNPITGDDFIITRLQYTKLAENVLHISLEMQSLKTNQFITISTAVYMPACEKMSGFNK